MTALPEEAFVFDCCGEELAAIFHPASERRGVLVVVGGPQYRVGSHRQFVLLARYLAANNVPVMRFDHRGIGDSGGQTRGFEALEEDIRAAIDAFNARAPQLRDVVIWGLCDAASAAAFYAFTDQRVSGLVLVNPWIRTDSGRARTYLKHYYLRRLCETDFWRSIGSLRWNAVDSFRSFKALIGQAMRHVERTESGDRVGPVSLPDRILHALTRFHGRTLLILSGRDLTAEEFRSKVAVSRQWQDWGSTGRVERRDLPAADHTFSRAQWRDHVAKWTLDWLRSW